MHEYDSPESESESLALPNVHGDTAVCCDREAAIEGYCDFALCNSSRKPGIPRRYQAVS
jgi:hypothetical protein